MKGHTYIFTPGRWTSYGSYWDEKGNEAPLNGETVITHSDDFWFMKSSMTVESASPISFLTQYEITPFIENFPSTVWVSHNDEIGKMNGMFTVVQESILSTFSSEDKQHTGFEFMVRVDRDSYRNEGAFYKGMRRMSSWAVIMTRAE